MQKWQMLKCPLTCFSDALVSVLQLPDLGFIRSLLPSYRIFCTPHLLSDVTVMLHMSHITFSWTVFYHNRLIFHLILERFADPCGCMSTLQSRGVHGCGQAPDSCSHCTAAERGEATGGFRLHRERPAASGSHSSGRQVWRLWVELFF